MKRFLSSALAVLLGLAAAVDATPVSEHGRLRIKDRQVVDSLGKPFQLTGMSLNWSIWGGEKFFNAGAIKSAVEWGANVIRIPIAVATPNATPSYLYKSSYKALVKTAVQAAIDNGVYAILDWHVEGDSVYEDSARAYFTEMAQTYGGTPNVLFEVWNEPIYASWDTIKAYAERQIAQIREYSPNMVLVGNPYWSSRPDLPAASPIVSDSNVAYVVHFYACSHGNSMRTLVRNAAKKIPLFFSEWGTSAANGSDGVCTDSAQKWLDLAKEFGVGWANWSLFGSVQTSSALNAGVPSTGGWSDDQLSASGKWVKAKLQEAATWRGDTTHVDTGKAPIDTGVVDTTGPKIVLASFDMPYNQNPRQTDLAAHMGWKDGGWWFTYRDDSGTTVTDSAGKDVSADTAAFSAAVAFGKLHLRMATSASKQKYPYAGLEAFFDDTASYFDLRKLSRVAVRAKGDGTVRLQFLTRDVRLAGDWGTYGADLSLDTVWKNFVIKASDLSPSQFSGADTSGWTWADNGSPAVCGVSFAVGNGGGADLWIDQIALYGVDSTTFAVKASSGIRATVGRAPGILSVSRSGANLLVSFASPSGGRIEARLVDLQGRMLDSRRIENAPAGQGSMSLSLPAGRMAILQLRADGLDATRMILPLR